MGKTISFSELKRKQVRKTIGDVEIYNPTLEQQKEIKDLIFKGIDKETGIVNINGRDILITLMPMLTNIYLDLTDENLINDILSDPSIILLEINDELEDIITEISTRVNKKINDLNNLPPEVVEEIFKEVEKEMEVEELTEEELKTIEKAKKLGRI